jgi:hypothetical protein
MLRLQILLQAVDRLTAPMRAVEARLAAVGAAAQRIGRESGATRLAGAMRNVAAQAGAATGAMLRLTGTVAGLGTAAAGIAAFGFNSQLVRPAAEMERYRITLETVEGSAAAAERALAWVDAFSTRTPFELAEVTRAFVDIRNLGLDPTRGALEAAGNAAAIMGTRYGEAVTALSAALRGEMDPIERFGVFARTEGENIVLNWEAHGRQMRAVVNKNNREMIAAAVQRAWTDKFAGGMDRLAQSWDGMLSNLADAWSRFNRMVMEAGVFDWMKERLEELLARVNAMAEDGTLRAWAEQIAASILVAFNAVRRFLVGTDEEPAGITRLMDVLRGIGELVSPVTDHFGTMETALGAIGLVLAGPLIASLAGLTLGMTALGVALVATPAGWFAIAAAGLIALAAAITNNWGGIGDWFGQQLSGLLDPFGALERHLTSFRDWAGSILAAWQPVASFFERLSAGVTAVSNALGTGRAAQTGLDAAPPPLGNVQQRQGAANAARRIGDGEWNAPDTPPRSPFDLMNRAAGTAGGASSPATATTAPRPAAAAPPAPVRVETGGQLNIRLQDDRAPQVTGRPANPEERWSINQGPRLVTP